MEKPRWKYEVPFGSLNTIQIPSVPLPESPSSPALRCPWRAGVERMTWGALVCPGGEPQTQCSSMLKAMRAAGPRGQAPTTAGVAWAERAAEREQVARSCPPKALEAPARRLRALAEGPGTRRGSETRSAPQGGSGCRGGASGPGGVPATQAQVWGTYVA